jgi:hypothetical protein
MTEPVGFCLREFEVVEPNGIHLAICSKIEGHDGRCQGAIRLSAYRTMYNDTVVKVDIKD